MQGFQMLSFQSPTPWIWTCSSLGRYYAQQSEEIEHLQVAQRRQERLISCVLRLVTIDMRINDKWPLPKSVFFSLRILVASVKSSFFRCLVPEWNRFLLVE